MHSHYNDSNNKDAGHKSMMWMMAICCLLPVVVLFGGVEFFKSIGYSWIGVGLVGIFLATYFIKMVRAKYSHDSNDQNVGNQEDKKNHGDCCH